MRLRLSSSCFLLIFFLIFQIQIASSSNTTTETTTTATTPESATESEGAEAESTTSLPPADEEEDRTKKESAENITAATATNETTKKEEKEEEEEEAAPVQAGPFIDLFGPSLLSLEMISETQAQLKSHYTNEVLHGKNVIGVYFSADWCGPCRQFTPDLVKFYDKINTKRGQENTFEIVWISRCRDYNSFGQYFTHMKWLALPPEEAMGPRGQHLSEKYKIKSIPTLVLLDDIGNIITTDGRNKIPMDKAGIGFPWRNPLISVYRTLLPRSLRLMVRVQWMELRKKVLSTVKKGVMKTSTAAPA